MAKGTRPHLLYAVLDGKSRRNDDKQYGQE